MNIISSNECDGGSKPHRDAACDTAALRNSGAGIHAQEQNQPRVCGMHIREERDASVVMRYQRTNCVVVREMDRRSLRYLHAVVVMKVSTYY